MLNKLKQQAKQLKKQIAVVYLAYTHKDVKWYKKAFLLFIIAYAISPIDLMPDFIPVLGLLDDLILIPLFITAAIAIIPKAVWQECKQRAETENVIDKKFKVIGAIIIAVIWLLLIAALISKFH